MLNDDNTYVPILTLQPQDLNGGKSKTSFNIRLIPCLSTSAFSMENLSPVSCAKTGEIFPTPRYN
eukprot:Pgem_evm1s12095